MFVSPLLMQADINELRALVKHLQARIETLEKEQEMAKLTAKARKKLPKKDFGLPGSEKYPMPDKAHAANAKARATQMVKKGKLSEASKEKIDAKANKILKRGKK